MIDEVSLRIEASAERCYDLVADITQMGRLSPECTGGRWMGGARGPAVGVKFLGTNRRGWVRWFTVSRVVAADRGKEFAFETRDSGTRWGYRFVSDGNATVVTESREGFKDRPAIARTFSKLFLGGVAPHDQEMVDGMAATLARLKAVAETP